MAGFLEVLKEIHQVRLELSDVKEQMKRLPQQLKARSSQVATVEKQLSDEKDAARKMRMAADAQELNLKQAEGRIRELKIRLNQVESNKEYSAIQDEINRIAMENDTLQDAILAQMSEEEEKRMHIQAVETRLAEAKADFAKFKEVCDYKMEKLKSQAEILSTKLAELEPQLGDLAVDYHRLTRTKGDAAIAACDNGTCQGCFSEQPPQAKNELILGRIVKCKNCGALLYPK